MPENYAPKPLIGYQLKKQIEQKAKETSKKKADAESRLQTARELLEHCKGINADFAPIEKATGLVVAALDGKDFDLAFDKSEKAVELAKKIFIDRIGTISQGAEEIVKIITDMGEEPQQLKQLIGDTKAALEADDFDSARKLAEETYDHSQKALHEQYAKIYSRAQQITLKAKEFGENVESLQKDLQNTKEMIESEDYTTAITTVKTTLEAASDLLKTRVVSDIDSIEDGILSAEDLGADVSKLKELITRSRELVNSLDFEEAMSYARRAQSESEKAVSGKIHEETRKLREDSRTTKKHGGEVDVVLSLVDTAAKQIKDHEIGEASRTLEKARGTLKEVQVKIVTQSVMKSKNNFVLAKKLGIDMSKAVQLLNESREKLQKGEFEDAIEASAEAEKEIENSLGAFRSAQERVESLSAQMKEVEGAGITLPDDYTYFDDAKEALSDRDFVEASEQAATGLEMLDKFLKKAVQEQVESAGELIASVTPAEVDIAEATELLESAKENLAEMNLIRAYKEAAAAADKVNATRKEDISETIASLEEFVDECSKSFDVVEYLTGLDDVKKLAGGGKYAEALAKINAIKKGLSKRGSEEGRRLIGESEMRLNDLEGAGVDAADLRLMLTKANEFFKQGMLDKAVATAKEAMEDANLALEDLAKKTLLSLKGNLEGAQADSVDVAKWRGLYKQSKESLDNGEYASSYQTAKRILDEMNRSNRERQAVLGRIKRCEDLLSDAGKSNIDTSGPAKIIENAKAQMNKLDTKKIAAMVDEAEYGIETTMGMFLTAKIILLLKSSLDFAERNGIDDGQATRLLDESKIMMKERKYETALISAKRAQAELARAFKVKGADEIAIVRGLIADAKSVGADVSRPERLLDAAQQELDATEFETGLKNIIMAKSEIEQIKDLSSKSAAEIKNAKECIRVAEAIGFDMAEPRSLLQQAMDALASNKYAISYEFSKKISGFCTGMVKDNLDKLFDKLSKKIEAAGRNGISVGRAESLLSEAKKAYNTGEYNDAIDFMLKCEQDLDRSKLQLAVAASALAVASKRLADAEKDLPAVGKAKKVLEQAQAAMKRKSFAEVISLSVAVGDEIERSWKFMDDCRRKVNELDDRIARLDRVGLEIPAITTLKSEAEKALQGAEYTSCNEICVEAEKKISSELETIIEEKLKRATGLIETGEHLGFSDRECPELLSVARDSAKEGLWDFAYEQIDKCNKKIESALSESIQTTMSEMLAKMSAIQKTGASVKAVEEELKAIEERMGDCDYQHAYAMLMDADAALSNIEGLHKSYLDAKYEADSAISAAKKFGMQVKDAEGMVAAAETARNSDYNSALEMLRNAAVSAKSGMEKFNPSLSVAMQPVEFDKSEQGKITVEITNEGKAVAKDLEMKFQGDFDVEEMPELPALKAGESMSLDLTITPRRAGDFEIAIAVTAKRLADGKAFEFVGKTTAKVIGKEPTVRVARAIEPATCSSCNGKIKPGFDIAVCLKCQSVEHLPCAKRTKKCGSCGAPLDL